MTEKQEKILKAALTLFANDGFNATSTNNIAKLAGVSEGLIFRHFNSKEGLLEAIVKMGEEQFKVIITDIIFEPNAKEIIKKTIELPFKVPEKDYEFWRLQFKLKWELKAYNVDKMKPLKVCLANAFKSLNYQNAELEAETLLLFIDGLAAGLLKNTIEDKVAIEALVKQKYNC